MRGVAIRSIAALEVARVLIRPWFTLAVHVYVVTRRARDRTREAVFVGAGNCHLTGRQSGQDRQGGCADDCRRVTKGLLICRALLGLWKLGKPRVLFPHALGRFSDAFTIGV